jgi:general secretion pathway protein M
MTSRPSVRTIALQILTLLLLLAPFAAAGLYVWQKHQGAENKIAQWDPRHARLQGILAQQAEFGRAAQQAQTLLNVFVFPAEADGTKIANEVQQRVQSSFEQAGFKIDSLQTKEGPETGDFLRLKITIRFDGNINHLHALLLQLRGQTPILMLDALRLNNEGPLSRASVQRITGQMEFTALRAKP